MAWIASTLVVLTRGLFRHEIEVPAETTHTAGRELRAGDGKDKPGNCTQGGNTVADESRSKVALEWEGLPVEVL